jgi:hypothetical protein
MGGGDEFSAGPVSMPRSAQQQRPRAQAAPQQDAGGFDPGISDDDVPF